MSMQVRTYLPSDVNAADKTALMQVSQQIVQQNTTLIDRFVAVNRQQISISGSDYRDRRLQMGDDLTMRYQYNQGREKLGLDVYPTGGALQNSTTSDTNLDGYVCWIHGQPNYPYDKNPLGLLACGPFALLLNGYVLEQSFQPRSYFSGTNCMGYTVMFGKTALLCNSYTGDKEQLNPLMSMSNLKKPHLMVPDAAGSYPPGVEIDNTEQAALPKKFGYWIFDWDSIYNPANFVKRGNPGDFNYGGYRWNNPQGWYPTMNNYPSSKLGAPNMGIGIYFPDTRPGKSPFVPKGQNTIGTIPSAGAPPLGSVVPTVDVFFGEFYDRGRYMTVVQSWNVAQMPNQSIAANNTPLIFGWLDPQVGYSTGNGSSMQFDLTPAKTRPAPDFGNVNGPNPAMMGPHDYFSVTGNDSAGNPLGNALTPQQAAQIKAWATANQNTLSVFVNQQSQDALAVINQLTAPQMQADVAWAHMLAAILRLYNRNVFLYTTGIYVYWANDLIEYATNAATDPNYASEPVYPPVLGPQPAYTYTLVTESQSQNGILSGSGVTETTFNLTLLLDTIPNTQAMIQAYRDLVSHGNDYLSGLISDAYTTVLTGYSADNHGNYIATFNIIANTLPTDAAHKVWGPATVAAILGQLTPIMTQTMTQYDQLQQQLTAIMARTPPTLTPFPDIGTDISDFSYSKFQNWDYNQNP